MSTLSSRLTDNLWSIFNNYDMFVSLDGKFFDSVTMKQVHRNHLKCMLRRDYLSDSPEIQGALLVQVVEKFIDGVTKGVNQLGTKNPDMVRVQETCDSFL